MLAMTKSWISKVLNCLSCIPRKLFQLLHSKNCQKGRCHFKPLRTFDLDTEVALKPFSKAQMKKFGFQ